MCCSLQINTPSSDGTEAQAVEFKINAFRSGIKSSRYVASNAGSFLFTAEHQVFAAMKLSWISNNNGNINILLLGKFAQSRKAGINFMSFRLSVRPSALSVQLLLNGFPRDLILKTCMKICRGTPNLFKIWYKSRALYFKTSVRFIAAGDISSPSSTTVQHSIIYAVGTWNVNQQYTDLFVALPVQKFLR